MRAPLCGNRRRGYLAPGAWNGSYRWDARIDGDRNLLRSGFVRCSGTVWEPVQEEGRTTEAATAAGGRGQLRWRARLMQARTLTAALLLLLSTACKLGPNYK